jgi:hypothetical protein
MDLDDVSRMLACSARLRSIGSVPMLILGELLGH